MEVEEEGGGDRTTTLPPLDNGEIAEGGEFGERVIEVIITLQNLPSKNKKFTNKKHLHYIITHYL